jgi:hypothetical protein
MIPEQLQQEVDFLKKNGMCVDIASVNGMIQIVFPNYPLPKGYNRSTTTILLCLPLSYPNGKPDMFWTDSNLKLSNGTIPERADTIETYLNSSWRRFSWHPKSWNPNKDNLNTFLEFVNCRLSKVK